MGYLLTVADVQSCLAFVRSFGLAVAVRSGGHSYGGYSTTTGLVIDVTRMNSVTTDIQSGTAVIGAGARLIDIYDKLAQHNLVTRAIESAKSDYFTNLLPQEAINNLVNAITQRQTSSVLGQGGIGIDAYGGAINRMAADATAFAHRNALFSVQYNANWNVGDAEAVVAANHTWLINTWQSMRSYASGAAYQNYVDPDLSNWQQAYYGANFARLRRVKTIYDPNNLFHFAQSIPPATDS